MEMLSRMCVWTMFFFRFSGVNFETQEYSLGNEALSMFTFHAHSKEMSMHLRGNAVNKFTKESVWKDGRTSICYQAKF